MKTNDLITLMTHDAPVGMPYSRAARIALVVGIAAAAALLFLTVGLRHNMAAVLETARVLFKIAVTLVLVAVAARLTLRIGRPGVATRPSAFLLLAPVVMLAAAVVTELAVLPIGAWKASLVGGNALLCLVFVPILAVAPLAAFIWALKKGAPENPTAAGAAAGLTAGAIAVAAYAWHCPDDSPLFIAAWYTTAVVIVTAAGAALGSRLLRW
jgi:hypothetical protein